MWLVITNIPLYFFGFYFLQILKLYIGLSCTVLTSCQNWFLISYLLHILQANLLDIIFKIKPVPFVSFSFIRNVGSARQTTDPKKSLIHRLDWEHPQSSYVETQTAMAMASNTSQQRGRYTRFIVSNVPVCNASLSTDVYSIEIINISTEI